MARKGEEVEKDTREVKESQSFTMNLFRGVVETAQVFPFPQVLNEEQKDNLKMLIDPTARFFEVCVCIALSNVLRERVWSVFTTLRT